LEERRQNAVEYQRLGIQGKTSKKVSKEICRAVCDRKGGIDQYSQTMITYLDKNPSSSKSQPNSKV